MVNVKMVNCHVFLFILLVILVVHINKFKEISMYNQMETREINEYFTARFVQILKAPEIINIWTILGDPGTVNWVRKNSESFQQRAREPLGCYS